MRLASRTQPGNRRAIIHKTDPRQVERTSDRGASYPEIMMVLTIMAMLLTTGIVFLNGARTTGNDAQAREHLGLVRDAIRTRILDEPYPTTLAELTALEPALTYTTGIPTGPKTIGITFEPDRVMATTRSRSGNCYGISIDRDNGPIAKIESAVDCRGSETVALLPYIRFAGQNGFTATSQNTEGGNWFYGDDLIPIDPNGTYRMTVEARADRNPAAPGYTPTNYALAGIQCSDSDQAYVEAVNVYKWSGANDTVLTAPLNIGDTTFQVADATGWNNGSAGDGYYRQIAWWPYTDTRGVTWPNYTFSRNIPSSIYWGGPRSNPGVWLPGGINITPGPAPDIITLSPGYPWPGPALPIGTPIRNSVYGGGAQWGTIPGNVGPPTLTHDVPVTWTTYTGVYTGTESPTWDYNVNNFRLNCRFGRAIVIGNYAFTTGHITYFRNVTLERIA
jgi:type II secretory pathway pseudopilin PulG